MARKASVKYWESRGAYMCHWRGRQVILASGPKDEMDGPTYKAAVKKFAELVTMSSADTARDENTVRVVMEYYMRRVKAELTPATVRLRLKILRPFVEALGDIRIRDLTRHQVNQWLTLMRQPRTNPETGKKKAWNDSTVNAAIGVIVTGFRWAIGEGLITRNPLAGIRKPQAKTRNGDALIGATPEERDRNLERIYAAATPAFLPFVKVLAATGARPGELANATAANFDAEMGAIVHLPDGVRPEGFFRHKTAGKGRTRVIILTGEALAIVKALVAKYPSGPLFRTSRPLRGERKGLPSKWTAEVIVHRFWCIRKATGLQGITAYSFRHQRCTDWLKAGKSIDTLAALMGNTPAILRQNYSHLLSDTGNLRRQLEAFIAEGKIESRRESPGDGGDGPA